MAEKTKENLDLGAEKVEKKSKVLLYVIIALVLVVLGMGAGMLYFMGVFGGKSGGGKSEAAHHEEPPAPPKIPLYVALDRDLLVNLPVGSEARLLQVGVTVLTYSPEVEAILKKHMPMLRNNLSLLLAAQDAAVVRKAEGKQALQAKILEEINKVVRQQAPDAAIEQIFFTNFILQ